MPLRDWGDSRLIGPALGAIAAVIGWWAVFIAPSIIGDASNTLGQPQFPIGARLVLVTAVIVTCAVAIWSRPAALTMATLAMGFISYSLLVFSDIAPALVTPESLSEGDAIRETLYAVVTGGASIPLLLLGGLWTGIALWWLTRRPPTPSSWRLVVVLFGAGIGVAFAAWWALPVMARAMSIMFFDGRDAFSIVPALLVLVVASGSAWLIMRWPSLGLGAAVAAVAFVTYSQAVDDPGTERYLFHAFMNWWSVSPRQLEESIRSAAFRPGTIELAAAWAVMALAHLLAFRRLPSGQPFGSPSPA